MNYYYVFGYCVIIENSLVILVKMTICLHGNVKMKLRKLLIKPSFKFQAQMVLFIQI